MAMWYQPQVDARAGRVIGFEALMRWNRAGRVQPAGDFIPIAEETGLIVPLGEWAVGESCRALAALHAGGLPDCTLAVNLSCSQLRTGRLPGVLQAALAANGLRGGALEVELTESGMMSDPEVAVAELAAVRALGAGLAVDDFGTGYSSLAYLTRLPLTTLKIDRSFVADIATSEPSRAVARTIVSLAGNLRLRAVAEGVETEAQRDVLLALGCTLQQGWLHGRAMPLSEALDIAGAHAGIAEVSS
jgi:EAL domain-containing protein (putative c-di-GMP-specific phosphodiesterase class I)